MPHTVRTRCYPVALSTVGLSTRDSHSAEPTLYNAPVKPLRDSRGDVASTGPTASRPDYKGSLSARLLTRFAAHSLSLHVCAPDIPRVYQGAPSSQGSQMNVIDGYASRPVPSTLFQVLS
jgi:hypothetical protein